MRDPWDLYTHHTHSYEVQTGKRSYCACARVRNLPLCLGCIVQTFHVQRMRADLSASIFQICSLQNLLEAKAKFLAHAQCHTPTASFQVAKTALLNGYMRSTWRTKKEHAAKQHRHTSTSKQSKQFLTYI